LSTRFAAVRDGELPRLGLQDVAAEIRHGDDAVGRAQVDRQHDARRRVERDQRRRAPAGRQLVACGNHEARVDEAAETRSDRRAGEPRELGELGARPRGAVAQHPQQFPRVVRHERAARVIRHEDIET
jgi:hypothetical protein